jgi:hypothetical protein
MSYLTRFAVLTIFGILAVSASASAAVWMAREVPYKTLMDSARAHAVVAAFDHPSFERAEASYPIDGPGLTTPIGTGRYLLWKITHLFPSDRRVERIALPAFRETCTVKKSQFGDTVACHVNATIAVTHGGKTRRFNFVVNRDVGRFVLPKPGEDWSVIYSGLASTLDDVVKGLAVQLRRMGAL